jgi:hypothetical protein
MLKCTARIYCDCNYTVVAGMKTTELVKVQGDAEISNAIVLEEF